MSRGLSFTRLCMGSFMVLALLCSSALAEEQQSGAAKKSSIAVLHVNVSGIKNQTSSGTFEEVISQQAIKQNRKVVPPDKVKNFLESEAGKNFKSCLSVSCTAQAGFELGAGRVISGNIRKSLDTIKINLQLIDTEAGSLIAVDRGKTSVDKDLALFLRIGVERLLAQDQLPAEQQALAAKENKRAQKEDARQKVKESRFYKGNLTTIGPLEVIPRADRVGVVTGYRRLAYTHYLYLAPELDLRFFPDDITKESKLRLGFGVPINLELYSGEDRNEDGELDNFNNLGQPRKQDWDSPRDAAKIIRYIQYGRKEDNLYVNIHRMFSTSIGHGTIMKRYIQNLDHFTTRVAAEFDAYSDYGGCELFTNDITWWKMFGGLVFIKPGSLVSDHWMAKSLSLGLTYVTDLDAPAWVASNRTNSDDSYVYEGDDVHIVGGDIELKLVKARSNDVEHDLKSYFDYSHMINAGGGITTGLLWRVNLFSKIRQAIRIRAEFRAYQDNYTPSYFDPFYEFMKYKWIGESTPSNENFVNYSIKPKWKEFSERGDDWNHFGGYFEFSYALLDYIGFTLALGDATGDDNADFLAHIEVPATKYFVMNATYMVTNFTSYKSIFEIPDHSMFQALARLRPIQLLAFQFGIRRNLQASPTFFPNPDTLWDIKADLDISWEF